MAEKATDPWSVGPVRVRRIRGPRDNGDVYWRATIPGQEAEPKRWCPRKDPAWSSQLLRLARGGAAQQEEAFTVLDLLARYRGELEHRREAGELKPRSVAAYAYALRYLTTALAEVAIDAMDVDILRSYMRDRQAGTIRPEAMKWNRKEDAARWRASSQTLAFEMQVLRAAWVWGRKRALVDRPLDVPRLKVTPTRVKYTPTIEEVDRVLAQLTQPWERAVVELLLDTGARIGEIAALTWGQVAMEADPAPDADCVGMLTLIGKTGPREIPLMRDVAGVLVELGPIAGGATRVLPVTNHTARMIGHNLNDACDRAGVRRFSPHGLRRLAVDRLYERYGHNVGAVALLLGQSPTVALKYYRKPSREALVAALRAAAMGTRRVKVLRFEPRVTTPRHSG